MKILHYSLGFSPYRSGGMTRYVEDLMDIQKKDHEVGLLWPGRMRLWNKKISIKKNKTASGIISFEMINPLPVPLLEGVRDIPAYMGKGDLDCFLDFFKKEQPDVIHIHTFMGLYAEFLEAAKQLNIKTVFTTHDYYAICPKVNMLCKGQLCNTGMGDECCTMCDMNPLSMKKIYILQTPLYRYFKESAFVKSLRKRWMRSKKSEQNVDANVSEMLSAGKNMILPYSQLKEYYQKMLQMISVVHCNSVLAKERYLQFATVQEAVVVPISNQNIVDKRTKKVYNKENAINITYLGPAGEYKGYFMLVDALDELNRRYEGAFTLHVYAPIPEKRGYIVEHDSFGEGELDSVLNRADILVAPSIWKETFGFVVLEALSRGVPVIVTENVGAKDLVNHGEQGFVIDPCKEALADALEQILNEPELLQHMNECIVKTDFPYIMQAHAEEMLAKIYS